MTSIDIRRAPRSLKLVLINDNNKSNFGAAVYELRDFAVKVLIARLRHRVLECAKIVFTLSFIITRAV